MKNYTLLTGATGFIGRYLLLRFLANNVPVVVVARGDDATSAKDRIQKIVGELEARAGKKLPQPICFTGDITQEDLGLDDFALEWFEQNCGQVLHNAASIRFHCNGDRSKDPWYSNYQGTQNVVELCRQTSIKTFHHVSTAYVCGTRRETVYENELDKGQDFANDYQESKLAVETYLREVDCLDSVTFLRPGIVVGDSRDGYTSAPDFGLYHYIQFNWQIIRQLRTMWGDGHIDLPIRLHLTGEEKRNLITVDWVADAIMHIVTHPELHNETYHLTPLRPIRSREIADALATYFDFSGLEFVGDQEVEQSQQTEVERMFYDYTSTFEAYWDDEPEFDRTNTNRVLGNLLPTPAIDADCLHKLIDYPVRHCYEAADETTVRDAG